jgi:ribosomal protein L11 methyltransferase
LARKEEKEMSEKEKWLEIILTTPPELTDALSNFLTELGTEGTIQEEPALNSFDDIPLPLSKVELKAYLPWTPEVDKQISALKNYIGSLSEIFPYLEKPTFVTNIIVDPDWGERWKKYFKPLRISKNIVIKPTWERYAPLGRDIVIDIDPGMAFGTGQHSSTRMCITALEDIVTHNKRTQDWKALDVGTGTGILAISCAKLGIGKVVAVDIDPKATEIAAKNIAINMVDDEIEIINSDISNLKDRFDLLVANLTANALIKLQPTLFRMMKPEAYLIISGITENDSSAIEKLFYTKDIILDKMLTEKEWVCYVLKKGERGNTE